MISYGRRDKDRVFAYRRQEGKEVLEFQLSRAPPLPVHTQTTVTVMSPSQQHIWLLYLLCGLSKAGREEVQEIQVIKKGEVDLL